MPKDTKIKAEDGLGFEAWTKKFERSTNGKKEKSKRQKLTKSLDELQAKPGYEWIQELRKRDDVDFREVKLAHKTWKYSTFSLTPAASALIALAVTIATSGTASTIASALVNAASMAVASAGTATATATMVSAVAKVAIATGIKSLASSAAVTLANNKGNIQKTFKDMGRSQFIRGIATAMVVAGATYGISDALGVSTEPATETVKKGTEIGSTATSTVPTLFEEVRDRLVQSSIQTGVATSVQIITEDLRWKDALRQGVINTGVSALGALGANKLSLLYNGGKGSWNYAAHKVGHFVVGGLMGATSNYKDPFKGFLSGGTGAMCAEVIMEGLPSTMRMSDRSRLTRALVGTGTFLAGGNVTISDLTATNAIENNSYAMLARLAVQAARTAPALERALGATTGLGLGLVAGEYVNEAIGEYTDEATGEYTNDNGSSNSASQGFFSALQGFVSGVTDELNGGLPQFRTPQRQSTMDEAPIRPITTGGFDVWDTLPGIFSTPIPTYQPTQPGFDLWDGHLQQMTTPIPDNLPDSSILMQYSGNNYQYWDKIKTFTHKGQTNKVYQRDDLIDLGLTDAKGRTNLELMARGNAPIGPDGRPVNLHHMLQQQNEAIAELTETLHKRNHGTIHINPSSISSGINRDEFSKWKKGYWKERAKDIEGKGSE